jgi:RNA polymerase sigma-70 factor (ECF subfamily)
LLSVPNAPSDADLISRAAQGDRFGVELIFRRHAGYLLGITTRLLADRAAAEAVVEATFLAGLRQLPVLREVESVRAWLARIAVQLARRRLRRAWWLRRLGWLRRQRRGEHATLNVFAALDLRPEDRAALARVDGILERARPGRRIAWMLCRVEGFDLDDVAAACGCSAASAWRRIADIDALVEGPVARRPGSP